MSQPVDHDMTAVLEAIDHYSDGDVDQPQEIMVKLQEGCSNKHKRLNKKVYEKELAKLQTELVKMQYRGESHRLSHDHPVRRAGRRRQGRID